MANDFMTNFFVADLFFADILFPDLFVDIPIIGHLSSVYHSSTTDYLYIVNYLCKDHYVFNTDHLSVVGILFSAYILGFSVA